MKQPKNKLNLNVAQRARVFDALSDPTRLMLVERLLDGKPQAGKQLAEALDITLALFCHHSTALVEAGVLNKRKQGQSSYYTLDAAVIACCFDSLNQPA